MGSTLAGRVLNPDAKHLAIVGLAKNAGKTVTFNHLVDEAARRREKNLLLSYGRDGEEIDEITRLKKPKIYIPPKTLFVTTDDVLNNSQLRASAHVYLKTGLDSPLGQVNVYQTGLQGGYVELLGINTVNKVSRVLESVAGVYDRCLIDGALNRTSSAIPNIVDGVILSTGAVVGSTVEVVAEKTAVVVDKFSLPKVPNRQLQKKFCSMPEDARAAVVTVEGDMRKIPGETSFALFHSLEYHSINETLYAVLLKGALVNQMVEGMIHLVEAYRSKRSKTSEVYLVVSDAGKVFLDRPRLNALKRARVKLSVMADLELMAITVNPFNPEGKNLSSQVLVDKIQNMYPDIPVFDVLKSVTTS